jgi:phosphoglycolate phosphatase-like HAD superfamily hydrolase
MDPTIPSPRSVLLFDIDGTLISAGGAGRRAVERALADVFGPVVAPRPVALGGVRLDGLTDRLIVRIVVERLGLPFDDASCDEVLRRYVDHLEAEIHGPGYRVLPGVETLLPALAGEGAVLGLCTGNVARGARVKLSRAGLDRWFGFGEDDVCGFADDGEAREVIVAAAMRRATARLGRRPAPEEVLVIGDTPRDVSAARAAGVPVLAVASGRYSVEELQACGPDHTLPSLEGPEALALLRSVGAGA